MRTSILSCVLLAACATPKPDSAMMIAHLGASESPTSETEASAIEAISSAFAARNPGYALSYTRQGRSFPSETSTRIVFVQRGTCGSSLTSQDNQAPTTSSKLSVGDLVVIRPGQSLTTDAPIDALVFEVPDPVLQDVPSVLRPDWDEGITDTPGGCATEAGAYRRVVLTWMQKNGPYNYRALNAHRVRITDSFTHYHPVEGGFDEFYLVQMVQPGARILTSDKTDRIINPDTVSAEEAATLLQSTKLRVGDLIYLPRGIVHRGLGGVLAHVITTPGFVPGAEIGVDHHLRRINERLKLDGDAALPFNSTASAAPLVK